MPQSFSQILAHIVFSTKHRQPFIRPDVQARLHAYLATVSRNYGCICYRSGGVADHVHLAVALPRDVAPCDVVGKVKTASNKWLKQEFSGMALFSWQKGYAAIGVNVQALPALSAYIDKQAEHHKRTSFREEYRKLLEDAGLVYDERFMWD